MAGNAFLVDWVLDPAELLDSGASEFQCTCRQDDHYMMFVKYK